MLHYLSSSEWKGTTGTLCALFSQVTQACIVKSNHISGVPMKQWLFLIKVFFFYTLLECNIKMQRNTEGPFLHSSKVNKYLFS